MARYPQTLLGSPEVENYYEPSLGAYFFDRNRTIFEYIMRFYLSDSMIEFPAHLNENLLQMELDFFGIGWRDLNNTFKNLKFEYRGSKERAFAYFNDHKSSNYAFLYMLLELILITISIVDLIVEDDPTFNAYLKNHSYVNDFYNLKLATYIGATFFTFDFVFRWLVSLEKLGFIKDITTWFDILALIPYYMTITGLTNDDENGMGTSKGLMVFKVFKLFRVARCFKIIRRSDKLRVILKILGDCWPELGALLIVWITGILLAGSICYIAENTVVDMLYTGTTNTTMTSIMESTWWAQVTMAMIGYGEIVPTYLPGKAVAVVTIIGSTILTALPMTFIIRRFSLEYEKISRKEHPWKVFGSEELIQKLIRRSSVRELKQKLDEKCEEILAENASYGAVLKHRKSKVNVSHTIMKSDPFSKRGEEGVSRDGTLKNLSSLQDRVHYALTSDSDILDKNNAMQKDKRFN